MHIPDGKCKHKSCFGQVVASKRGVWGEAGTKPGCSFVLQKSSETKAGGREFHLKLDPLFLQCGIQIPPSEAAASLPAKSPFPGSAPGSWCLSSPSLQAQRGSETARDRVLGCEIHRFRMDVICISQSLDKKGEAAMRPEPR